MVAVWLAPIYIMAERWGGEASTAFHFSPRSRLDRFMDLKHARGFDFIYFIIHSLVYCARETTKLSFCDNHEGLGEGTFPLVLDYAYCQNPICFLEWENRFICRCGPLEVTLVHKAQTHMSREPRVRGHLYITLATCNTSVRCIFKWDSTQWENDCNRQKQDFLITLFLFHLPSLYWISHPAFAVYALICICTICYLLLSFSFIYFFYPPSTQKVWFKGSRHKITVFKNQE